MNKHFGILLVALSSAFASACAVGPDYQRPASELPQGWADVGNQADTVSLNDWWLNFDDAHLTALIEESLQHNNDLKIAAANVKAAAASLRLARADYIPTVNAAIDGTRSNPSEAGVIPAPAGTYTEYSAGLVVNYEIDLWGRVRRANEAAFAELRSDVAVHDAARASIAAAVARAWFETRALDRQIALLERLLETRQENLRLQNTRLAAGLIAAYDLEQARSETAAVAAQLPRLRSARLQALNALAVLRGASPQAMLKEWTAARDRNNGNNDDNDQGLPAAPTVPMGLPSELLERRPDIRAAEQRLVAANARIGEAKAAYFPRLSLTGFAGGISTAFNELFDEPSESWQAGLGIGLPLTDINRVGANVNAADARFDAATAEYAKTIQVAFQETLDALGNVAASREVMQAQDQRVNALRNAYRAAEARYQAGNIGYLELLDVERQLRRVEQNQVDAQLALLQATVDLYRALGGGWQEDAMVASRVASRE